MSITIHFENRLPHPVFVPGIGPGSLIYPGEDKTLNITMDKKYLTLRFFH